VYKQSQQVIITTPLLEGTDGVEKMSKSYDNYIGITEPADDMYGKTLSIPDALISRYFEFATDISNDELDSIKNDLDNNISNPRDLKRRLARSIVTLYYDEKTASDAETNFDNLFIKKAVPDDMPEIKMDGQKKLILIMVENKMAASNGEAKRLIKQGGVKIDDEKIDDIHHQMEPKECILKVGKRKFLKITV
jgi:tyrosyl-tRNA synthetase